MAYPKIAACNPTKVLVEKDKTYAWCTCGLSVKQPFCDGSHKTDPECDMKSLKITFEEEKEVWLCNCKHTKNPPFCDGSHKSLSV